MVMAKVINEPPYKIGKWYKVVCDNIIASSDSPEFGYIKINSANGYHGWKPCGRLFIVEKNEFVMIAKYLFDNQIVIVGIEDKFLYTEVAELQRRAALAEAEVKQPAA